MGARNKSRIPTEHTPVLAKRRPTLADIARKTGAHIATVSQILNDHPNCWASAETRRRVARVAVEIGYRPNLAARSLRTGLSHVIGYITPGFGAGSPQSRAGGLTDAAARYDCTVTVSSHPNDAASEDRIIRRLIDRAVDGLVIYPTDTGPHTELQHLVADGFPVVTLNGAALLDFECDDISPDYEEVGRLQVGHLLQKGRRCIGLVDTRPAGRINDIRNAAIRRALQEAGAPPAIEIPIQIGDDQNEFMDPECLLKGLRPALKNARGHIDAIIGHDTLASLAARILLEDGCRIPGEVAIMGAGNSTLAIYGMMPLTSISTADAGAGTMAFTLLQERIAGTRPAGRPFRRIVSPSTLVERLSTIASFQHPLAGSTLVDAIGDSVPCRRL